MLTCQNIVARRTLVLLIIRNMQGLPHIFISATTGDLGQARQHVINLVLRHGGLPVVEEGFEAIPDYIDLDRFLNLKLRACAGVIHLAGLYYGSDARRKSRKSKRCSWTQLEYYEAKKSGKDILVCLADPEFYQGNIPTENGTVSEQKEKKKLQCLYYEKLKKSHGLHYPFKDPKDLSSHVGSFLQRFQTTASPGNVKVLFIGAEKGTNLDLTGQLKRIRKAVTGHGKDNKIEIAALFNAPAPDIIQAVNQEQPTIVHLSGRQEGGNIMLHDRKGRLSPFDADRLASALASTNSRFLKLVILDTCYSMQQAKRLTARGVGYAIGIYDAIADDVAIDYYATFYSQIASGSSLRIAMNVARDVVVGAFESNVASRKELEQGVLEMPFDPVVHIPTLSNAAGLDAVHEVFV